MSSPTNEFNPSLEPTPEEISEPHQVEAAKFWKMLTPQTRIALLTGQAPELNEKLFEILGEKDKAFLAEKLKVILELVPAYLILRAG